MDQPGEKRDLGGGFRGRARLHNLAQMGDGLRTHRVHHFQHALPFIAPGAALNAAGNMIDGGVRHAPQHFRQALGKMRLVQRFLNELGQGIPHLHAGPEQARQSRLALFEDIHGLERLLDGGVLALGRRFMAEAHERCAHERLQVGVALPAHRLAHVMQRRLEQ